MLANLRVELCTRLNELGRDLNRKETEILSEAAKGMKPAEREQSPRRAGS